jgi:hypothetical protein
MPALLSFSCQQFRSSDMAGADDFDFLVGEWRVRHERRQRWLDGCEDWSGFDGTMRLWPLLDGHANIDDNVLDNPNGPYRAATLRSFDPASGLWSIWWLDSRQPHTLDVPMKGRFEDGVGTFYADDTFRGRPIRIRFLWTKSPAPRWEQAFSADGGGTWEVNWTMDFERVG